MLEKYSLIYYSSTKKIVDSINFKCVQGIKWLTTMGYSNLLDLDWRRRNLALMEATSTLKVYEEV